MRIINHGQFYNRVWCCEHLISVLLLSLSHKLIKAAYVLQKIFLSASVSYWKSKHMRMMSPKTEISSLSTRFWVCGLLHQKCALEGNIDGDDKSRSGSTTALRETSDSCEHMCVTSARLQSWQGYFHSMLFACAHQFLAVNAEVQTPCSFTEQLRFIKPAIRSTAHTGHD